jgi:hypothetical protein
LHPSFNVLQVRWFSKLSFANNDKHNISIIEPWKVTIVIHTWETWTKYICDPLANKFYIVHVLYVTLVAMFGFWTFVCSNSGASSVGQFIAIDEGETTPHFHILGSKLWTHLFHQSWFYQTSYNHFPRNCKRGTIQYVVNLAWYGKLVIFVNGWSLSIIELFFCSDFETRIVHEVF